jgi:hypothetical protein
MKITSLKILILDFHPGMDTDFWFWGFFTVCRVNFATTFREPLWLPSSTVISWSVNEQRSGMPLCMSASHFAAHLRFNLWSLKTEPTAIPKLRGEIYLTHRAKSLKPKISMPYDLYGKIRNTYGGEKMCKNQNKYDVTYMEWRFSCTLDGLQPLCVVCDVTLPSHLMKSSLFQTYFCSIHE